MWGATLTGPGGRCNKEGAQMLPAVAGIGMFMNALEGQRAQAEARRRMAEQRKMAQANILQQSAANLGAPTYNVQGAEAEMRLDQQRRANQEDERQRRNAMLRSILGRYGNSGGGARGDVAPGGDPFGGVFGGY